MWRVTLSSFILLVLLSLKDLTCHYDYLLAMTCQVVTSTGGLDDPLTHTPALIRGCWDQTHSLCILPIFPPNPLNDNKTLYPTRAKMGRGDASRIYLRNKHREAVIIES